jgi:hypothetical protein
MCLGSVGRVKVKNRLDPDSHADCCVCGKKVHIFNDFDREVTVTGCDPEEETQPLWIVSAALGYTIPQTGKTVRFIFHQIIFSPILAHNLLCIIKMRLYDVVVNETPKFQCQAPTDLSHTISVRGDNVDSVLIIPLELDDGVSCFPTFKPSQEKFDTYDRYALTYESAGYDHSAKTFSDQEAIMTYSQGRLKVQGDLHPKWRQVCTLRQKEMEIKKLTVKYSYTSAKLQYLSIVLDDSTLLAELNGNANISDLNVYYVNATMRDNGGVDPATLTTNWGIGIEAANRTHLVTTQKGGEEDDSSNFNESVQYQ